MSGRKRHLLVDTSGRIWGLAALPAAPTDWDGAVEVFDRAGDRRPRLARVWAESAYRALATRMHRSWRGVRDVVTRREGAVGFEVQPWRGVVERTFGWFDRYRRLSKDDEHNPTSSEAWSDIAMIQRRSRASLPDKDTDNDLMRRPPKRRKN